MVESASTAKKQQVSGQFQAIAIAWLTDELRGRGWTEAAVVHFQIEPLVFTGATTDIARIRLRYADAGTPGPASAIVKMRGRDQLRVQMDATMRLFEREARFYSEFASRVPVRTPMALGVGDGDATPLMLADLGDLRLGNQIEGLSPADAEKIVEALAAMHSRFWEFPGGAPAWLNRPVDPTFKHIIAQLVDSGATALAQRFAGIFPAAVIDQVVAIAPRWSELLDMLARGPNTLVHNDCRLDNLFFEPDGTPVFVDWQLVASTRGIRDVSNLLAGSMESADLAESWERLLRRYHDCLLDGGVTGYCFDDCVLDYRRNIFWALGQGMALLGALGGGDDRGVGDRIIRRALPHIVDLESFAALGIS